MRSTDCTAFSIHSAILRQIWQLLRESMLGELFFLCCLFQHWSATHEHAGKLSAVLFPLTKQNNIFCFVPSRSRTTLGSRDRVIAIATGYGMDDQGVGVRVPVGSRIFSSPRRPDRIWGPLNLLSNWYRGSFAGVQRPGCEAYNSPPASTEGKKMWIYTSTPPYVFMA
jgi:hypothetical protein